jgi:predicted nucleic acid-binding protein
VLSTQVLQAYFFVATRTLGLSAAHGQRNVELSSQLAVVEIRLALLLAAIDQHRLHQSSFWDALILQAASSAGCGEFWTEDLHSGAVLSGVRVVDPFAA